MTDKGLAKILECISYAPDGDKRDEATKLVLQAASESFDLEKMRRLLASTNAEHSRGGSIEFTKKEIDSMPESVKKIFIVDEKVVTYRFTKGIFQARYRRDGYNIEVGSKDYPTMKKKFIARFIEETKKKEEAAAAAKRPDMPLFKDALEYWLQVKSHVVKPATIKSYRNAANAHLFPVFGERRIDDISRRDLQDYLLGLVEKGKYRSASYLKTLLAAFYRTLEADYGLKVAVASIELPRFETKKGSALTKAEERQLVDYCLSHPEARGSSANLLLIYTGMRVGELSTVTRDEDNVYCVSEKTRLGCRQVTRKIPISPMLRRVISHVDFDKVRETTEKNARDVMQAVFPGHHVHETRYTFITRAKECGVNPEVVMLFVGHSSDVECASSRVDRGYTTFSDEYIASEIQKMDYDL